MGALLLRNPQLCVINYYLKDSEGIGKGRRLQRATLRQRPRKALEEIGVQVLRMHEEPKSSGVFVVTVRKKTSARTDRES